MNDQKKRFVVFSIIVLCCFGGAYLFFHKKKQAGGAAVETGSVKKDSVVIKSLFFESFDLENCSDASASTKKAFSGKKSSMLSPSVEYGFGVTHALKDFSFYKNLKTVSITFKCLTENNDTSAYYVFAINDKNGKNISWAGKAIKSAKKNDWADDTALFEIAPQFLNPDNTITFYPWNRQKKNVFIDDINISYIGTSVAESSPAAQSSNTNFFFDFETATGLTGTESIKETTAHSGKFACALTGGKEYGPSVTKKISEIAPVPFKKIALSAWVYPLTDDDPNVVLTAATSNSKNENISWDGKSTENRKFPKNKWTKINASFSFPVEKLNAGDIINVNIWNKGKTDVIVDDLEIVYGESAERKGLPSTIDMNSLYENHFVPQRNKPPFQTIWFQKQEINNGNGTSILPEKNTVTGDFSPNDNFITGNFFPDKNDLEEVICLKNGPDGTSSEGLYGYSPSNKQFEKIWENTSSDPLWNNSNLFYSQDFNNDGKSDILFVNKKDRSWILADFNGKEWVTVSKGKDPKKEWMSEKETISSLDGKDLFKSSDLTFRGNYLDGNNNDILKLNTDWRFDLKIIRQDKDGYMILGNVDFKGYPDDHNPKYYEFVKIIPGKFMETDRSSIIVVMRNCADDHFNGVYCKEYENLASLPNSTQLYSIEEIK